MEKGLMYEGKAKKIFYHDEEKVIVHYKDDATAFNGEKREEIASKGEMNNTITSIIFKMLEDKGIRTHFIEKVDERKQLCRKVEIIPLEVIIRNKAAGSMCRRYGIQEGMDFTTPVFELSYKNDDLGDPLMNDDHAKSMGLVDEKELSFLKETSLKINELLISFFKERGVQLVDFKLEFGRAQGEIFLADEISPDTCRFWDIETGERLDKDRFRMDLGNVIGGYEKLLDRLN